MNTLATLLFAAGGVGVLATFALAFTGDTPGATRMAGIACSALVLGLLIRRR
ncbi:hypothetical protein [Roseomonas sp. WA12]